MVDTTDGEVRRPHVPRDLDEELADAVTEHVRIPADRLNFADRVRVLLEEYRERGERLDELQDAAAERDELRGELEEARERIQELQAANQGGRFINR